MKDKSKCKLLPSFLNILWWISLPGSLALVLRIVYEKTYLTWMDGPQVIGFNLAHSIYLFPLGISIIFMVFWLLATLIWIIFSLSIQESISWWNHIRFILTLGFCLLLIIPYGTWIGLTIDILGTGSYGGEILVNAAGRGDLTLIKKLIKHGVDINSYSLDGSTVLMRAVGPGGNIDIVKFLLENGSAINERDRGTTALTIAKRANNHEIVQLLIKYGAIE